ncbi:Retrovirus-related Pol polyprotein from transposon TNT 1-94 [Araneus ventricosus]|uniref:Retrovirus-related Pol polyprotein from transposon TNT 1-94 n=1 Tax=Araneus ventricosus TaxID=182803 RepID=A0A4Y2X7D4_ARAVE|nr:Retrovirus-related Pol polyprotein from transposon TNT 1-94 [Araneus ventricosus]
MFGYKQTNRKKAFSFCKIPQWSGTLCGRTVRTPLRPALEGVDYTETFSPVISMPSLRVVLVLMLQENLHSYVMNAKTTFLNGDLDEVVYMSQPQGYDDGTRKVCKLNKSLYGLKQAPRQWF